MTSRPLQGTGVLVTRPASQNAELSDAIESAGGFVFRFPVIDIVPRERSAARAEAAALGASDIVIFVSQNAVTYGIDVIPGNDFRIAAIGPATRSAVEHAGYNVSIYPDDGFDSEHLLDHPDLLGVSNKRVLIVRGNHGRELISNTLAARGATVSQLAVYDRVTASPSADSLLSLQQAWNRIDVIVAMSVQSLTSLLKILPVDCRTALHGSLLVTPSKRVIQTALELLPDVRSMLATGPQAPSLVETIVANRKATWNGMNE